MVELRTAIVLAIFIIAVVGDRHSGSHSSSSERSSEDFFDHHERPILESTSRITEPSTLPTTKSSTHSNSENEAEEIEFLINGPTALERAHWCRFNNGSFVPYGSIFLHKSCALCECTRSRLIRCEQLECLPTYCVDSTMPKRREGQCCAQCEYEGAANSCLYNGTHYPHGIMIKSVFNKLQCWCQFGNIECRQYFGSLFQAMDIWADGVTIYIIGIIIFAVLVFGILLCGGCTFFIYYSYQRHQLALQQAYEQSFGPSGWEPVDESEEYEFDASAEEKRLEAEQYQSQMPTRDNPPPYAHQN